MFPGQKNKKQKPQKILAPKPLDNHMFPGQKKKKDKDIYYIDREIDFNAKNICLYT